MMDPCHPSCNFLQKRQTNGPRNSTTSFSTATTLIYPLGAGITAAAGTRLALQLFLNKTCTLFSFQLRWSETDALLMIVTSSLNEHWEICAPAAFLRCSSRLSGSFSGIKPSFPVIRHRLASSIHLQRNLIKKKPISLSHLYCKLGTQFVMIHQNCWLRLTNAVTPKSHFGRMISP